MSFGIPLAQADENVAGHEVGGVGVGDGVGVGVGSEPGQATKPKLGHSAPREHTEGSSTSVPHTPTGSEQGVVRTV